VLSFVMPGHDDGRTFVTPAQTRNDPEGGHPDRVVKVLGRFEICLRLEENRSQFGLRSMHDL